jgi:hypothetical protein
MHSPRRRKGGDDQERNLLSVDKVFQAYIVEYSVAVLRMLFWGDNHSHENASPQFYLKISHATRSRSARQIAHQATSKERNLIIHAFAPDSPGRRRSKLKIVSGDVIAKSRGESGEIMSVRIVYRPAAGFKDTAEPWRWHAKNTVARHRKRPPVQTSSTDSEMRQVDSALRRKIWLGIAAVH